MDIDWQVMTDWTAELLRSAGLDPAAAEGVAANLEYAERRGFSSHGYMRLGVYVDRIRAGGINRRPQIRVIADLGALVVVDADAAAGAHSAAYCTELAIAKAGAVGAAVVISTGANHFGAAGFYTDRMAIAGLAGIASCNTDAVMCAPFGGRAVLGTNPLSVAVPVAGRCGPQLDMATSEASYGKILLARDRAEQLPSGWAVDDKGFPTQDPASALAGALLPTGGPKGFGLVFMLDCLMAIGGAATSDRVGALYGDPAVPQGLGHLFIAIRVDAAGSADAYEGRVAALIQAVHTSGTPGAPGPLVPGEPERQRLTASAWGVDKSILSMYHELSLAEGVSIPEQAVAWQRP